MKKYIILALAFMAGATFNTVKADDIDSVSYAVGVGMGMQLRQIDAAELSVEKIAQGIADALNSIRGFNMSCQVVVQSLSQWQEKYPGKEWENQLATFDQTLYMGCNDMTSAEYISKKCGKVTISQTTNQRPQTLLFASVYSGARYSQSRSNTQRELMQPDEILRLDRRQCIALFQGRKTALLYKLAPEEFPDYGTLTSCRVADYTPEWRLREEQAKAKETPAPPKPKSESTPKQEPKQGLPDPMDEPNPTRNLEYQFDAADSSLGMVELDPSGVLGGDEEDEELPPGR